MTFDDDFMRFILPHGAKDVTCKAAGVRDWPPPEFVEVLGLRMRRESYSKLSDEDRAASTALVRASLYVVAEKFH